MSTSSEYSLELSDSIQNVDLEAWQKLAPSRTDIFMNPGLLGAVETSMAADASFWYAVFRDTDNRPVASATISTYLIDSTVLAVGVGAKIAKFVGRVVPALTRMKILFLGMPFSAGQSHVRFARQADRTVIAKQLAELLEQKAKETKSEIIVAKEFQEHELEWASGFEAFGYRRADSLPMNYMPTKYESFDASLKPLRSKNRSEIRRERKKIRNSEKLTHLWCRGEEAARRFDQSAHKLYENVLFRSKTRSEYLPREFFTELALRIPDNVEFSYCYEGEQLISFGCCLSNDEIFYPLYAGLDYERNVKYSLYSNLLFEGADRGLQSGCPNLWVGANADALKNRKLGTYQEPRYLYVRGGWWLARLILKYGFTIFFPRHEVLYPRETSEALTAAA